MIYHFCTYFDRNYLCHGLALYHSLRQACPEFRLWVLCMDQETHGILVHMALSNMELIGLGDFERGDNELKEAKKNRTKIEYYFTCTPSLPLFILNNFPEVDLITYVDADIYFFNNPAPVFKEISNHSIGIVEHRFSAQNEKNRIHGTYNVGWLSFRRDKNSLDCLDWWRQSCNRWCYDHIEGNRFGDQKYMDDWPKRFKGVVILRNKGANVAPWNIANYKICVDRNKALIDGQPLIFFHFHGFRRLVWRFYSAGMGPYKTRLTRIIRNFIYRPYLESLLGAKDKLPVHFNKIGRLKNIRSNNKIKQFFYAIYYTLILGDYVMAPR